MAKLTDRPLAAEGLTSYRYQGRYDWLMIGASCDADALMQVGRSTDERPLTWDKLQVWDGAQYVLVGDING